MTARFDAENRNRVENISVVVPSMLRSFLLLQVILTSLTAIALVASPPLFPSLFGVHLARQEYVLGYTLAAAEISTTLLSILAMRLRDTSSLQYIVLYFAALHFAYGSASAYAAFDSGQSRLWGNGVAHFVIAAIFALFLLRLPQRLTHTVDGVSSTPVVG